MLNKELEITLNLAFKEAKSKRHEFMTVEHLLLALLDNETANLVLESCGANISKLRQDLVDFVDATTPLIPTHDEERENAAYARFSACAAAGGIPRAKLREKRGYRCQCAGGYLQ